MQKKTRAQIAADAFRGIVYHATSGRCWCKKKHSPGEAMELSGEIPKAKPGEAPRKFLGKQQPVTRGRAKSQMTLDCRCSCKTCRSSHHRQCRNNCGR
jgi:hypothetical protein